MNNICILLGSTLFCGMSIIIYCPPNVIPHQSTGYNYKNISQNDYCYKYKFQHTVTTMHMFSIVYRLKGKVKLLELLHVSIYCMHVLSIQLILCKVRQALL